ncbi:MAG: hypothetical protein KIT17_03805 [Rubrivivax sp.]|nr:hypothetical protein [Rubrivivax sp.]
MERLNLMNLNPFKKRQHQAPAAPGAEFLREWLEQLPEPLRDRARIRKLQERAQATGNRRASEALGAVSRGFEVADALDQGHALCVDATACAERDLEAATRACQEAEAALARASAELDKLDKRLAAAHSEMATQQLAVAGAIEASRQRLMDAVKAGDAAAESAAAREHEQAQEASLRRAPALKQLEVRAEALRELVVQQRGVKEAAQAELTSAERARGRAAVDLADVSVDHAGRAYLLALAMAVRARHQSGMSVSEFPGTGYMYEALLWTGRGERGGLAGESDKDRAGCFGVRYALGRMNPLGPADLAALEGLAAVSSESRAVASTAEA